MRTYDEMWATARDQAPFSNSTDGGAWEGNWCGRCIHDTDEAISRVGGCNVLLVAVTGRTPTEFLEQDRFSLGNQYHCIEFRDRDNPGPGWPLPDPELPGQEELLPADPYRGVRMYADVVAEVRSTQVPA